MFYCQGWKKLSFLLFLGGFCVHRKPDTKLQLWKSILYAVLSNTSFSANYSKTKNFRYNIYKKFEPMLTRHAKAYSMPYLSATVFTKDWPTTVK